MRRVLALLPCLGALLVGAACQNTVIVQQVAAQDDAGPGATSPQGQGDGGVGSPASDGLVLPLGTVTSGTDVPFEIPQGALGFNIVMDGAVGDFDPNAPYGIQRITDPTGKVVLDNFTPAGGVSPTSTAEFGTLACASIPQGEATNPVPGTWKLRIGVQNAPTKKVRVTTTIRIQTSGDGAFHGGKLDLHLHVPDGLKMGDVTITSAQAAGSIDIASRVAKFYTVLGQLLQIDRGEVVFHTADSSLEGIDTIDELGAGFQASAGSPDGVAALHVLLTNHIAINGEPFAAGISPGIPGAANVFGRLVSTIIITTSQSADFDALAMVHEAGHFFGLNHTSEFAGGLSDPLSDTPRCTGLTADPPSFEQMKQCPDRKNIMFPASAIEAPIELSPEQIKVYHGSPIYQAYGAGTQKTQSLFLPTDLLAGVDASMPKPLSFRSSGGALSALEAELSLGFCGLNKLDAQGLMTRHGATTAAQLRSVAADGDLAPFMRGRARLALKQLGL